MSCVERLLHFGGYSSARRNVVAVRLRPFSDGFGLIGVALRPGAGELDFFCRFPPTFVECSM